MARENEKECLGKIKKAISGEINVNIFSNCELKDVSPYIFSASENANSNVFPDFIFEGGGIEHFELTSSKETKKGSEFKIEENKNKQLKKEYEKKLRQELPGTGFGPNLISIKGYDEEYDMFTYDDFLYSLKRNIVSHVESMIKTHYQDKIVFFLMEQQTARLWVDEGVYPISFYELHKDKKALDIIKENCKMVNYLIYCVSDSIEIIDLSKIDSLLENSSNYNNVKGGKLIVHNNYFLH